jgi:metallo-beta-lactamase class B
MNRRVALTAMALLLLPQMLPSQQAVPFDPNWVKPFPPFRVIGNIYWVGTWDLATYLITTPQGHILINSGFKETVPQIVQGIEAPGFKPADVKLLLATHAHFDHVAGLAELKRIIESHGGQLPGRGRARTRRQIVC